MKTKPIVAGIALLGVLAAVGATLVFLKMRPHAGPAGAGGIPPEFVEFVTAEEVPWQPRARLVGTAMAVRSVNLSNEIVGVVKEVGFDSGATVEAGQVLVKLDDATEQADLAAAQAAKRLAVSGIEVAEAEMKMSKSALDLAKSNLKRYKSAATASSVSAADVDKAESEVDRSEAALQRADSAKSRAVAERDQAEARVRQIETIIAKKTLKAPFRARAGMRTIHPGQYLAEGTNIVSLTELTDNIYVDFAVPQEYAARVSPGTVVTASSKLLGTNDAKITVVSIDATVNPVTRNVRVRSSIPNPDLMLKPGMFIDVEVPVAPSQNYVVIPATSVRRAAFGDHVFVLTPDSKGPPGAFTAKQRMVQTGALVGDKVIVNSGLKTGELVASGGSFKLREGALVMQSPPAGAPGAPKNGAAPVAQEPAKPAAAEAGASDVTKR
ncbi:MAG: efflux RND transporter periplasmic adaptor subunit [Planctomycetes bacterium]|nr:efflux RND transporter periplasmic adaptor subunit [Planctomycetota bacterium]